jgi:hypothetical protein
MLSYYMGMTEGSALAKTVKALQWIPEVTIDCANNSVDTASFHFNETMPWLDDSSRLPSQKGESLCQNCAVYMASETATFYLSESSFGSYQYFSFDAHELSIEIAMQDTAQFHACGKAHVDVSGAWAPYAADLKLSDWQALLLPTTSEWMLTGNAEDIGFENVERTPNACQMVLQVTRNPIVFLIKQILVTIFFVLCGLLALLLAPTDLMGDRVTTILFSALIVSTNMQNDIGLGSAHCILWFDWFNLV